MIFTYIDGSNTRNSVSLLDTHHNSGFFETLHADSKLEFIKQFIPAYNAGQKLVLFDKNHTQLLDFHQKNNINSLKDTESLEPDTRLLFFTSGSSGFPVGAFKTQTNLAKEVKALKELVSVKCIKRVVVTVPFVHIYGVLGGLLLPLALGEIELIVKEDFLPYELIEEVKKGDTLVITTPVFIKALGKLSETVDMSSSLFISSTGPLHTDDISVFETLYSADVMQLFGSTETGGIAYKFGVSKKWIPLRDVSVEQKNERLSVSSPYISTFLLQEGIQKLELPFTTEDIIEIDSEGFELLGRSNKIIKIAGKRISALAIESLLEKIEGVERAVVTLVYKKELLRSEQILITLQAKNQLQKSFIKQKINESYGVLTIPFKVVYVETIKLSSMGKKVLF
ncbi:FIGfam138462: Acyl-CoA synthetase, AMP-(fatty) acid ligase [hydrothermal vent metagenome]|uniref:FIGfam138462: Acyl-CoA synthetase, AMP-(Fatty) acid ligase n=1 Tax=hydrothermal vent metagenome TaxID=652676 RepID=A0A1W1CRZ8_9ZZZZ